MRQESPAIKERQIEWGPAGPVVMRSPVNFSALPTRRSAAKQYLEGVPMNETRALIGRTFHMRAARMPRSIMAHRRAELTLDCLPLRVARASTIGRK
jgi:hypothetical protein